MQLVASSLVFSPLVNGIEFNFKPSACLQLLVLQLGQVFLEFIVIGAENLLHRSFSLSELFV